MRPAAPYHPVMTRVLVTLAGALGLVLAIAAALVVHAAEGQTVGLEPGPPGVSKRLVAPAAHHNATSPATQKVGDGDNDGDD